LLAGKLTQVYLNVLFLLHRSLVRQAVTLVGLIYLLILAFIQTIAGAGARAPLEPYLTTKSLILVRLAVPFISYFPLSLFYTMVDLPFEVPFGAKFTFGAGFVLWWMFVYMGMLALGLATEAVVTLVGPPGMPYMLFVPTFFFPDLLLDVLTSRTIGP
jgi:hypothetical protein